MFNKRKIQRLEEKIDHLTQRIDLLEYKINHPFLLPVGAVVGNKEVFEHVVNYLWPSQYESFYRVYDSKMHRTLLVRTEELDKLSQV